MSESKEYPIGIQNFEKIVSNNFLYIDKTEFIYSLAKKSGYYFLSRPRRFGKSLLLSTLEAFFKGKRELFKGLAIERHEDVEWQEYPVLHLDFNAQDYTRDRMIPYIEQINFYLCKWEKEYGHTDGSFWQLWIFRFSPCDTKRLTIRPVGEVVVLIDEYDKPLLQNLSKNNEGASEEVP